MTEQVFSVPPGESLERVYAEMAERGLDHVTVVQDGEVVGVVSQRDLLRYVFAGHPDLPLLFQRALLRQTRVEEVMTSEVETADPDQPLAEAAQVMSESRLGCLPVVVGWRVVGMLTQADFVRYFTGVPVP